MRRSFRVTALALTGNLVYGAQAEPAAVQAAPAFTAQQQLVPPTQSWITNGGTLYNQRYSPLALINRDNVKNLRALWRTRPRTGRAAQIAAASLRYAAGRRLGL